MNINAEKITRVLLALILVIFGLNKFFNFLPMPPMPEAAQGFMGALIETGYLMLFVAIIEIILDIFLLLNRYSTLILILICRNRFLTMVIKFRSYLVNERNGGHKSVKNI